MTILLFIYNKLITNILIIQETVNFILLRSYFLLIWFLILYFFFYPNFSISLAFDPTNSWSSTTNLPNPLASHASQSFSNKVFVIGGATGNVIPTNLSSIVTVNGSLQDWNSSINSPSIYWHSSVIKDNHIYLLGGATYPPTTSVKSVYLGTIDGSGVISSWTPLKSLLEPSSLGAATITGNKIYFAGGFNEYNGSITVNRGVYWATINSDGTLGDWTLAGLLPEPLSGFGMIASGNNIIIVGGARENGTTSKETYTSHLNADGSLSGWQPTSSLPEPVYRSSIIHVNNILFSIGGYNGSSFLNKVYYATINQDGTLSSWKLSEYTLPEPVCCGAATAINGYIYLTGGFNGQYLDTVYFTKLNNSSVLNVSLFKQTANPWQSQIYDSADLWNPAKPTIYSWGCAISSAAMVLNYHGIKKLPDGTALDPGTLNTWLKSQPDGYVRNGLVNWLALSRLSKLAKQSGNNPEFVFDALEYRRTTGENKTQLTQDLANNIPSILEVPGHFVVAKGTQDDTFVINDPFYDRSTLADGYENTFLSLSSYIPSTTDLSYFFIVGNSGLSIALKNSSQSEIGDVFTQAPLHNDEAPLHKSGEPVIELLAKNPQSDTYTLTIGKHQTTSYSLDIYLYDKNGEPTYQTVIGFLSKNRNDRYTFFYDHDDYTKASLQKIVTFHTLIDDINEAISLKLMNKEYGKGLIIMAKSAQKSKNGFIKKSILKAAQKTLAMGKNKLVKPEAYDVISEDITTIFTSLN